MFSAANSPLRPRRLILVCGWIAGLCGLAADAVGQGSVADDRAALEALYHATGGPSWTNNTNWLSDAPLGEWYGVETAESGRVEGLRLGGWNDAQRRTVGNGLSGSLPSELGGLVHLRELRIEGNEALTGPIPAELGNLLNLEGLSLGGNELTGSIPATLGNLTGLRDLSLWGHAWTAGAPAPAWLGALTNLEALDLGGHGLTGPIPADWRNLTRLHGLHLWGNSLTGTMPAWLGDLTDLRGLGLNDNRISGPIPPELGSLTRLETLDLGYTPLFGAIPPALAGLSALTRFHIVGTSVCVPSAGAVRTWVEALPEFESSGLTCEEPVTPVTVSFAGGTYLVLEGTHAPVRVRLSTALDRAVTIGLTATPGGGATAADYAAPATVTVWPDDTSAGADVVAHKDAAVDGGETVTLGFAGVLPPGFTAGGLATTTVTIVDDDTTEADDRAALEAFYHATGGPSWTNNTNWLSDAPLGEWYGVETAESGRVEGLRLGGWNDAQRRTVGNGLSGSLPSELGGLVHLRDLRIEGNEALTGPIPAELGNLLNLEGLSLGGNELTGSIPATLGNLTGLRDLSLWGHAWTAGAPAPAWLGALTNLEALDLGGHGLTGPIPADWRNLTRLHGLHLWGNSLTGTMPAWLGDLTDLRGLGLNDNRISGPIPPELGSLTRLETLDLGYTPCSEPSPRPWPACPRSPRFHIVGTSVCVPSAGAVRTWVEALPEFESSGLTCEEPVTPVTVSFAGGTYLVLEGTHAPVRVRLSTALDRAVTIGLTATPGGGRDRCGLCGAGDRHRVARRHVGGRGRRRSQGRRCRRRRNRHPRLRGRAAPRVHRGRPRHDDGDDRRRRHHRGGRPGGLGGALPRDRRAELDEQHELAERRAARGSGTGSRRPRAAASKGSGSAAGTTLKGGLSATG